MRMRFLFYILLFIPLGVAAQGERPYDVVQNPVANNPGTQPDVAPAETIPQGVIKVRKAKLYPFFKCEYYLTCAHVRMVQMEVPSPDGIGVQLEQVPMFDSAVYARYEPIYPHKTMLFSKHLWENVNSFSYSSEDSASIDTMKVHMRIGSNGKVRWTYADTTYYGGMPRELALRIYLAMNSVEEWGEGGGYLSPKKFMRKQTRMGSDYYCLLYVIASAKPLTNEQKSTQSHYAPFDIPLNAPPENDQQREFLKGNNINYHDPETKHHK